jgi:hypothetical protein
MSSVSLYVLINNTSMNNILRTNSIRYTIVEITGLLLTYNEQTNDMSI